MTEQPSTTDLIEVKLPSSTALEKKTSSPGSNSESDAASEGDTAVSLIGIGLRGPNETHSRKYSTNGRKPSGLYPGDLQLITDWIDKANDKIWTEGKSLEQVIDQHAAIARQDNDEEEIRQSEILIHITISEDQTAASDIDRRRLLAAFDSSSIGIRPVPTVERSLESDRSHDTNRDLVLRQFSHSQPLRARPSSTAMQPSIESHAEPSGGIHSGMSNPGGLDVDDQVPTNTRQLDPEPESKNDHGVDQRIEQLQREIARLQMGATGNSTKPPKYEVFNVLPRSSMLWLGKPTWELTLGRNGDDVNLKGNHPMMQPDVHLERQGNIAFVVFSVFTQQSINDAKEVAKLGRTALPDPAPTKHDVELRSQAMKDAAKSFFQELKKMNEYLSEPDLDRYLSSPFLFWYHYRSSGVLERLSSDDQRLMRLLTDWIDQEYGSKYTEADDLFRQGFVTVSSAEYLIKPGEIVIETTRSPKERSCAYMAMTGPVRAIEGGNKGEYGSSDDSVQLGDPTNPTMYSWLIHVWTYSYDGQFWKDKSELRVTLKPRKRQEKVKIKSLQVYPARFADKLKLQLEQRGKTFWSCRYRRFVAYPSKGENDILTSHGERYMVDFPTYRKLHSDTTGFKNKYKNVQAHDYMPEDIMEKDEPPSLFSALFPPTIAGFNLRHKKWNDLEVDKIQDLKWNKDAFERLVIDDETKELIHALITNRIATERNTDWISAKGNGLIMLLHGGPGTGKTFTAESVAELAQKPLYPVTCGDIGTRPEDVEKYLESVLTLGRLWDCVVLLDEADVFLEQRTLNDLKRNALVSVFLRVLEYYEGILILTSNRVGIFDEAFKSRIQLALHYENLQKPQRVKIWKNFLSRLQLLGEEDIDYDTIDSYIDELSDYDMNGRQIRNAITTARQLAKFKGKSMGFGHLRHVIKVAGKFDHYLLQVHDKISDDQIARGEGFR